MKEKDYIEIDVLTKYETDLAVLFSDGDNEFWIPKSVMEDWPEPEEEGTAVIEEWFAYKEGLI
jgi:hypothetical protein